MTFTVKAKSELTPHLLEKNCCQCWELAAMFLLRGYLSLGSRGVYLSITVDYSVLARYLFRLIKACSAGGELPQVTKRQERRLEKTRYVVQVAGKEQVSRLLTYLRLQEKDHLPDLTRSSIKKIEDRCCRKAFLRGAFLAGGSVSVPRSGYHLEIGGSCPEDASLIQELLGTFNLASSLRRRNGACCVYLKKADSIADFLRIIGAHQSLLEFESMRVVKSMRNQVNRLVNCDTANLEKVIASAQHQLMIIDCLDLSVGLHNLPPSLREAAYLRRSYPEASLKELGEMLNPPLGKSDMNHRFRQLENLNRQLSQKGSHHEG